MGPTILKVCSVDRLFFPFENPGSTSTSLLKQRTHCHNSLATKIRNMVVFCVNGLYSCYFIDETFLRLHDVTVLTFSISSGGTNVDRQKLNKN